MRSTPMTPAGLLFISFLLLACHSTPDPAPAPATTASTTDVPASSRGCKTPVAERQSEAGCFLTIADTVGPFDESTVYWHLYTYPSAAAAEAARGPEGTVASSFGQHWVYTITSKDWQPATGRKIAVIGPLSVVPDAPYTARYMEAVFPPDFQTAAAGHRHSGAEAWYVVSGAQCLETPDSLIIAHAGEGAVVPAGPPMSISGYGSETRKAVLIVLHPPDQPWVSPAPDWTPRGRCRG